MTRRIILFLLLTSVAVCSGAERSKGELLQDVSQNGDVQTFLKSYCLDCHGDESPSGEFSLIGLQDQPADLQIAGWERVVRKVNSHQMPPSDQIQPEVAERKQLLSVAVATLDSIAKHYPNPGRTDTFRRLNQTEYRNAIRDLLHLDVDVTRLLPKDEASHGFDNVTVAGLSPTLLNRYLDSARKISRLAIGRPLAAPEALTVRVPADLTQEDHLPGLPFGTRGGTLIEHTFPQSGEYEISVRLMRDRNEHVEGLRREHQLVMLLDRKRKSQLTIYPPKNETEHQTADHNLRARFFVPAGPHQLGVTFLQDSMGMIEIKRKPYAARFNMHRHPRQAPAIYQVTVLGPIGDAERGETPSRRQIFGEISEQDRSAAAKLLKQVIRRAYRRPVSDDDLEIPLRFFDEANETGGFEYGIESALSAILVNPNFLFRIERDPEGTRAGTAYQVTDVELASRLSFFLWSSLPDNELLQLAESDQLHRPEILREQTLRMLRDERSESLVTNFADQWLYLRNLESITPDLRLFPDFDDNLRRAFRRETELLFQSIVEEDRNVLDLLRVDYTFLNERLAKHYEIPHIYGSHFRRVELSPEHHRGGLLRHGSILTVTSYATRTSPVIRGHWILKNLFGAPPPPPPDNVPALKDNTVDATLSVRDRLAEHRANPACASCHDAMDPVGFALENFDAVGRWRDLEAGQPVDSSGSLPGSEEFVGVAGLESGILKQPELFVGTLTEKLFTFALGRGIEPTDGAAVRQIVRQAEHNDYRFSELILGIVQSDPFLMRTSR